MDMYQIWGVKGHVYVKEGLNSDNQRFLQYQQRKQSHLTSTH
jgi:hypothetical protein